MRALAIRLPSFARQCLLGRNGAAQSAPTRAALIAAVVLAACTAPPEGGTPAGPERAPRDDRELGDPIVVRMGGRELRVRCALACDRAREQLTGLRDGCVSDPTSTPHHLDTAPAMIALACCTEAAAAYERACGDAALAACVSRWSAECDAGRVPRP